MKYLACRLSINCGYDAACDWNPKGEEWYESGIAGVVVHDWQ